jgi:hypothetical protein
MVFGFIKKRGVANRCLKITCLCINTGGQVKVESCCETCALKSIIMEIVHTVC